MSALAFSALPDRAGPVEAHGRDRADVALLVAERASGELAATRFGRLAELLGPGDLLVVNVSGTLPAALPARMAGEDVRVHLSTPLCSGAWAVEIRGAEAERIPRPLVGAELALPAGGRLVIEGPYRESPRLAVAAVEVPGAVTAYLAAHGEPIRYPGRGPLPLDAYQTVFAREPGSAEMPSAGRPFTRALVTDLVARGVQVAPLVLHCGVSSLESRERPYPERFRVPAATARLVGATRAWGGRVVAVGTTVVRALETIAAPDGTLAAGGGRTDLVITPERGVRVIDGLITGWHEPASSHLDLLAAVAGTELLERSYTAAAKHGFSAHEFGDAHLILP